MAAAPEFHLPLAAADLLRDGGPGRYVVREVLPARELPPALAGKMSPHPRPGRGRSCRRLTAVPPPVSVFSRSFPGRVPCAGRAGRAGALRLRVQRAAVSTGQAGDGPLSGRSVLAALTPCVCPAATSEPWARLSRRTPWS